VYLEANQISDISPLSNLTNLGMLRLDGNQISDLKPLVDNAGLSKGDMVYLKRNPLNATSVKLYIPQLEERGVNVSEWEPRGQETELLINIGGWDFSFELPSEKWSLMDVQRNSETGTTCYLYRREGILDSKNIQVVPIIAILFEEMPKDMDAVEYSTLCREREQREPFIPEEVFTHEDGVIDLKNAMGYVLKYTDSTNEEHTVKLVYAVNGKTGIQVIMDVTTELFPIVEPEFNRTLKSLRFTKPGEQEIEWETYMGFHNLIFSWSIKHPADWVAQTTEMGAWFYGKDGDLGVGCTKLPIRVSAEEYVPFLERDMREQALEEDGYRVSKVSEEAMEIDGEPAVELTYLVYKSPDNPFSKMRVVVVAKDRPIFGYHEFYVLMCGAPIAQYDRVNEVYFEPMIQSFEITTYGKVGQIVPNEEGYRLVS
jgi:hypothetical protein